MFFLVLSSQGFYLTLVFFGVIHLREKCEKLPRVLDVLYGFIAFYGVFVNAKGYSLAWKSVLAL